MISVPDERIDRSIISSKVVCAGTQDEDPHRKGINTMKQTLRGLVFTICWMAGVSAFCNSQAAGTWTHTLENGMSIVMIEDHSAPMVASVICIRAGSHMETPSENGLSHLLEHLLFDGTTRSTRAELEERVTSEGGYFNAFTRKDYVAFEIVMPSDKAALGLAIQAEQLLESTIPETELAKERNVVCEEIAKDLNDPASAADDEIMQRLFGKTGYGLPVIGNYQTVKDVSRDSILRFYRSYYTPNRMTAVIIGDFSPTEMLRSVKESFGNYPRGPEYTSGSSLPQWPSGVPEISIVTRNVSGEAIRLLFPAPSISDPASLAFAAGIEHWSAAPDSPLQTALTGGESPLATQVSAFISDYSGFSFLEVAITPVKNDSIAPENMIADAKQRADAIRSAVIESAFSYVNQAPMIETAELDRMIRKWTVDFAFSKEKFHHFARDIVHYEALNVRDQLLNRTSLLTDITQKQVSNALYRYLSTPAPVMVMVIPGTEATETISSDEGIPVTTTLSNGLKVIARHDSGAPIVGIHLLVPVPSGVMAGVPRLTAEMLDAGTVKRSASEISEFLDENGLRIKLADNPYLPFDDYYSSQDYSYFRMESLADEAEPAMRIMAEMALESTFPDEAFQSTRRRLGQIARRSAQSAGELSRRMLDRLLYPDSLFVAPVIPDESFLDALTIEQIRDFHRIAYHPASCILSISGDLPADRMIELAETTWGQYPSGEAIEAPKLTHSTSSRAESGVASGEQAYIRYALPVEIKPDQIPALEVAAALLSDRLQETIREKLGMAYRLGAFVSLRRGSAVLEAGVGTRAENREVVEAALKTCISEWLKRDIDMETVRSKANALQGEAIRYRMPRINRAYYAAWREFLGFGYAYESRYLDMLDDVTIEQVKTVVRDYGKPVDQWFRVVVDGQSGQMEK